LSRSAVQWTVILPCLILKLLHYQLCLGQNSETTRGEPFCGKNLFESITRFKLALVLICFEYLNDWQIFKPFLLVYDFLYVRPRACASVVYLLSQYVILYLFSLGILDIHTSFIHNCSGIVLSMLNITRFSKIHMVYDSEI
jgi:hypothetical protein